MSHAAGALYRCRIAHRRPGPPRYRFVYRCFYVLVDIDALDQACAASPLISHNRFNVLSLHDADHGPHNGSALRPWLERTLADYGVAWTGGTIQLLTMPRVLGYGFNPISLFYCFDARDELRAVVIEVHNTFGEHHFYVLQGAGKTLADAPESTKAKRFHVSPFFDRRGVYRFHLGPLAERLGLGIRLFDDAGQLRIATALSGQRKALTTGAILRAVCAVPLMSLKVAAAIHWQALKLWLRGAGFRRKPDPERPNVS